MDRPLSSYPCPLSGRGQLGRGPSRRTPPGRKLSGASSNPLAKIHTEIAILKKCKHENIVCLKEVIDDSESPEQNIYLVFELMANGQVSQQFHYSSHLFKTLARARSNEAAYGPSLSFDSKCPTPLCTYVKTKALYYKDGDNYISHPVE